MALIYKDYLITQYNSLEELLNDLNGILNLRVSSDIELLKNESEINSSDKAILVTKKFMNGRPLSDIWRVGLFFIRDDEEIAEVIGMYFNTLEYHSFLTLIKNEFFHKPIYIHSNSFKLKDSENESSNKKREEKYQLIENILDEEAIKISENGWIIQ